MSVNADAWAPTRSAYTPSHMDVGPLHGRRQGTGIKMVRAWAGAGRPPTHEASQAHAGATLRLEPHPRERSVE